MLRPEADWNQWPAQSYVDQLYSSVLTSDAAIIDHHSAWYRSIPTGSVRHSLELGAGPNLYPLMLMGACSEQIDAVEPSSANRAYLRNQLAEPDQHWQSFWAYCRNANPALPEDLSTVLGRVNVLPGGASNLTEGVYDLVSMHFVAETATSDALAFRSFCAAFVRSARPGGLVVAAFMENMPAYRIDEDGPEWPAYPVTMTEVREALEPVTSDLTLHRVAADPTDDGYEHSGMIVVTARRPEA
jgi:hypothetical protein